MACFSGLLRYKEYRCVVSGQLEQSCNTGGTLPAGQGGGRAAVQAWLAGNVFAPNLNNASPSAGFSKFFSQSGSLRTTRRGECLITPLKG